MSEPVTVTELIGTNAAVVRVLDEIDVSCAPKFREALVELITEGRIHLIVNLDGAAYFDSTGLGVLVGALIRIRKKDPTHSGSVMIVTTNDHHLKLFRATGLTRVFNVLPDDASAIAIATSEDPSGTYLRGAYADSYPDGNWASARVYLSDEQDAEAVEAALRDVLEAFDLEVMLEFDPIIESWFRETLLHIRSSGRMRDQLAKLERAIDMQTHLRPQAEIDASQSEAVAKLITAVEKTPNAIIQIGSVLLVKVGDDLAVRNLTQRELALYERRPELFRDPATALAKIQTFMQDEAAAEANGEAGVQPPTPHSLPSAAQPEQPVAIDGH